MHKLGGAVLFLLSLSVPLSAATLTGRVTLQADGSALPGVTVLVEGTGASTVSDIDGRYTLNVPNAGSAARVTAMLQGFQTRSVNVDLTRDTTQDFVMRVAF